MENYADALRQQPIDGARERHVGMHEQRLAELAIAQEVQAVMPEPQEVTTGFLRSMPAPVIPPAGSLPPQSHPRR